jgi:hypothetical protein
MRTFRVISVAAFLLAMVSTLGALSVAAQGQIGDSPFTAPYIDNLPHTIAAGSAMWFRFDYSLGDSGDRPVSTIVMVNGNKPGLGFEVWTPEALAGATDSKPVGRGGPRNINCDTGAFSAQGECQTADLTWVGAFGMGESYFVRVFNNTNSVATILLTITGSGVSLPTPTPVASNVVAQPTRQPAALPAPTAPPVPPAVAQNIDDPNKSVPIDGVPHTIAANSATWFRFAYAPLNDNGGRVGKTVRLVNGNHSGVRFEVWTPDHVNDWWDNQKPVGRGTVYMLDCDTGEMSETGQCESPDLIWMGSFNTAATYYVRVVNDNRQPAVFTLTIQ